MRKWALAYPELALLNYEALARDITMLKSMGFSYEIYRGLIAVGKFVKE